MSAVFAIVSSDASLLPCLVHSLREQVSFADRSPGALGVGYFQDNEVLLRKRPGNVGTLDLFELSKDVRSEVVLFHAREGVPGEFKEEDTPPFRRRRWLFAHAGTIEAFSALRPALVKDLPDGLARQIKGGTEGEHAFMCFLGQLRKAGHGEDVEVEEPVLSEALAATARGLAEMSRRAGAARPSTLNLFATNGRMFAATRLGGGPLFYSLVEGIAGCQVCGITPSTPDKQPLVRPHRTLRAVAMATDLAAGAPASGWIELPEGHVIGVGRSLQVQVRSI